MAGAALLAGAALAAQLAVAAPASAAIARTAKGQLVSYQPTVARAAAMGRYARTFGPLAAAASAPTTHAPIAYKACSSADAACLSYFGGPVMKTTTLTPIFWKPGGVAGLAYPANFETEIKQFFTDLALDSGKETNFFSVLTQYSDAGGKIRYAVKSEPALNDGDSLPKLSEHECITPFTGSGRSCVTDLELRAELEEFIAKEGLATGLGHEYVVFLPQNLDVCFDGGGEVEGHPDPNCSGSGFCGYHTTLEPGAAGAVQYATVPENAQYAFKTESGEEVEVCTLKKGLQAGAETLSSASHEISESVTDPEPEAGTLGWYDLNAVEGSLVPESEYGEIGDMCAYEYAQGERAGALFREEFAVPAGFSNQTIDGHPYLLQTEWDNAHGACTLSEALTPDASFSGLPGAPVSTGEPISVDATASKAHGGVVSYEWNWGDGTVTSGTSATAAHSYIGTQGQHAKAFPVTLKISDKEGNTDVTSGSAEVTDRPPEAAISAPTSPTAGSAASFVGSSSSDPDGTIVGYSWSFGDGSPAEAGPTPSHTYGKAGMYAVSLTVTDDAGQSATSTVQVIVAAPPNALGFGRVKQGKDGGLTVSVTAPYMGVLSARDGQVGLLPRNAAAFDAKAKGRKHAKKGRVALIAPVSVDVAGPGEVTLHLTLTAAARRGLLARRKLSVSVLYTFAPLDGTPASVERGYALKLVAKRHRKSH